MMLCLTAHPAIASPIRLSHQGRLLESSGAPIEGEHAIGIRLVADDGTVLWTDTVTTTLNAGYYHLVLGAQAPLDGELFRGGAPHLELSVDGGAPISASGPIAHVPYAAVADHARLAERATTAVRAETADHAESANHAASADEATTALHATSAERATEAEHATTAGQAERATTAAEADFAQHASTADRASVAEQLEADELELLRLTSATIHGGTGTFDSLTADTVAGDHLQSTTALIGTVQAGRVNAVVALGAGSGLVCDAGNRGVLRYPPGGPLQICQSSGWTEVGASEGAGTCSIVGECPGGGEPSRVWFDQLALVSPEAVDHLCSRYDRVLGGLRVTGTFGDAAATQSAVIPCVDGVVADILSNATLGTIMPLVDNITYDLQVTSRMEFAELQSVGRHLTATQTTPQSTLPALHTVGGDLTWTWPSGHTATDPLPNLFPELVTVGGDLSGPTLANLVPMPKLVHVGGDYNARRVDAPNLESIGGKLTLLGPQPELPALRTIGGDFNIGTRNSRILSDPPFSLDSLVALQSVGGNLSITCVRGWELPELNAFVDRIGRANIAGTVTLQAASYCAGLP